MVIAPPEAPARPRLRGAVHAWAAGVSLFAGPALCLAAAARPGWRVLTGCAVYALTLCALFGVSALFHRVTWSPRAYLRMKRLDHATIFLFIAGCTTAFDLVLVEGAPVDRRLAAVWAGAFIGVGIKVARPRAPRWLSLLPYPVLASVALSIVPDIEGRNGAPIVGLLIAGCVFYSIGALCWMLRWPNPWPRTFAHHEIYHAAVVVAAAVHYAALYVAVAA